MVLITVKAFDEDYRCQIPFFVELQEDEVAVLSRGAPGGTERYDLDYSPTVAAGVYGLVQRDAMMAELPMRRCNTASSISTR